MRASILLGPELALPLALLMSGSGCAKEVKADFPRPPVTSTMKPPPVEGPGGDAPEAPPEEGPPESVTEPEPTNEPEPLPKETPRPRPRPAPDSSGAPKDTASPAEPPSTQLAGASSVDPALAAKMDRASALLGSIGARELTPVQSEQLTAARAFVSQARRALEEGDPRRALVLVDKGLILAEDVERLSRP